MARIRTIKPDTWTDENFVQLSPLARLLFIGMWNFVDDEGRAEFSPMRLKLQILPADNADISALLDEIRGASRIIVYTVDGKQYFQVCNFSKHQKIDKRTASKHPSPPNSPEFPRNVPTEGNGREGKGKKIPEVTKYVFESGVIRLTEKDFNNWKEAFEGLDLRAELIGLTEWAGRQDNKWFSAVSGALAKRNRELKLRTVSAKTGRPLTPSGQPWPDGIV
jgi:hypothetical protein